MGAVKLENVPKDRLAADLHHRFWLEVGFFADAAAEGAGEDYGFHGHILFGDRSQEVIGSR